MVAARLCQVPGLFAPAPPVPDEDGVSYTITPLVDNGYDTASPRFVFVLKPPVAAPKAPTVCCPAGYDDSDWEEEEDEVPLAEDG